MRMPGSNISNALKNDSYAVSFIHLELKGCKEAYVKAGESKVGIGLQDS